MFYSNSNATPRSFKTASDGTLDGKLYILLFGMLLNDVDFDTSYTWYFDWDNDGIYDQTVALILTPEITKIHNDEAIPAAPATCTEPGLTEGKRCSVCGEVLVEQEEIPPLGHDWDDERAYCIRCNTAFRDIAVVKIHVVDDNGSSVPGASVYFDIGTESMTIYTADSDGCAEVITTGGTHDIGCFIADNKWLPAMKTISVQSGKVLEVEIAMERKELVSGTVKKTEMSPEEIADAGIDVTDPDNRHYVRVDVNLVFSDQAGPIHLSFYQNSTTGETSATPVIDNGRKFIPYVIGQDSSVGILEIPVEASFLKEFFNVKLHILNNAEEQFSLTNTVAKLNLPEGLTLVDTPASAGSAAVSIGEIPGQGMETVTWILRGDKEGEYYLSADCSATLSVFDESISARLTADEPLVVYGLSAVKLIATLPSSICHDKFCFDLSLENISDKDVNMPTIGVADNIVTSYLIKIDDELIPEDEIEYRQPELVLLETLIEDNLGNSRTLGAEETALKLASGERLTKKYVINDVFGVSDAKYLREVMLELLEGEGVQFEIVISDEMGHSVELDEAAEPSCTESGLTEGKRCTVCGEVLVEQEELPPLGHDWDEGVVTTEPTHTETGIMTYTCNRCGETREESLPMLPDAIGDVNGDGLTNAKDIVLLMRYLAGDAVEISTYAADVNNDGRVNAKDLVLLMQFIARCGLLPPLPILPGYDIIIG